MPGSGAFRLIWLNWIRLAHVRSDQEGAVVAAGALQAMGDQAVLRDRAGALAIG